jgi:glutathione reductase (NADPH)
MDVDAVAQLHSETERIGVDIHTGVEIQRIEPTVDRLRVIYKEGDSERALEADRVIGKAILSAH